MKILSLLGTRNGAVVGVSELARETGYSKSLVHRTLSAMVETGFAVKEGKPARYRLGPAASELSMSHVGSENVRPVVLELMQFVTAQTGETTALSLQVGFRRVYAAQVESAHPLRMAVEIGKHHPLYAGASGRAILSQFSEEALTTYFETVMLDQLTSLTIIDRDELRATLNADRERGYTISRGERHGGGAGVSVPVFGAQGDRVVGALSALGPGDRFEEAAVEHYAAALMEAATRLSNLGYAASALQAGLGVR